MSAPSKALWFAVGENPNWIMANHQSSNQILLML